MKIMRNTRTWLMSFVTTSRVRAFEENYLLTSRDDTCLENPISVSSVKANALHLIFRMRSRTLRMFTDHYL